MANVSPISTLERQYNHGVGRLLLAVHCNAACCVTLQDVWKVQTGQDSNSAAAAAVIATAGGTQYSVYQQDATPSFDSATDKSRSAIPADSSESTVSAASSDDPFAFLNTSGVPSAGMEEANNKKKPNFGRFLKKVAATSTKAIERGMHHLAVKADQGRTPDYIVLGLFDDQNNLLSATEAEPLPEFKAAGVRFRIPLEIPAECPEGTTVVLKLWVRSGAALVVTSKHYLLAETGPLSVGKLREALQRGAPALFFPVPLNSASVVDGLLQCTVIPDRKFPAPITGRGWSLQDPNPATAYYASNMFHLPLDQSYAFTMPNRPVVTTLLATERSVESTVVLPIATAFAQLAANACRSSMEHLQAVSKTLLEYRHDAATGPEYADVGLRISHLRTNTASASYLQNQKTGATVAAMLQRPDSIFEIEVMAPVRLPLHPTAAEGMRPDISCRFYPKPVRRGILPAVLLSQPGGRLPPTPGFLLGNVRLQINVPKQQRKSDGTAAAAAPENPFDPVQTASASDETWECVISLEGLLNGRPGETKECTIYNLAGQNMGTLIFLALTVQMVQQLPQVVASEAVGSAPSSSSLAAGGLVALVGLPNLMDGIFPALDFDDTMLLSGNTSEQQRRRSQLATMGNFVTNAYLDQHLNFVRKHDCEILAERAVHYKDVLEAAYAPPPVDQIPSHKDRTPRPFRPSASRVTMHLSGIPFNVHTASLSLEVLEPPEGPPVQSAGAVLHNITCGAPADHARGFGNVFATKEKATTPTTTVGLKSPLGPATGGLRRLEAARRALAEEVSNQQTILIMTIANHFDEKRQQIQRQMVAGVGVVRPVTHVPAGNEAFKGMRWKIFEAVQCLHHLTWTCAVRRASVFSQALGIAVSSYMSAISDNMKLQSNWPELWTRHGFLVSFEGLLSAAGKELGMIEDASVGIDMLRMVRIILVPDDGASSNTSRVPVPHSLYIRWLNLWTAATQASAGQEIEYILQIGIDPTYFVQRIPPALKNGAVVRLYPILFEVGVDIFQAASNLGSTMSRTVTSTGNCEPDIGTQKEVLSDDDDDDVGITQDDTLVQLNFEGFQKIDAYAQSVSPAAPVQATQTHQTHPLLATLFQHIVSSSGKMNHDILDEAAGKVQQLGGGACVFCKSGKDRTAMHVTYKQAQFATRFRQRNPDPSANADGLGPSVADTTFDDAMLFRLYGTRLPICQKNVGQSKYAFNSLQVKFMPDALKPPPSALAGFLKGGKVFGGGGIES